MKACFTLCPLLLLGLVAGCSTSRTAPDGGGGACGGEAPTCYGTFGGACCVNRSRPASCVGEGYWDCGGDTIESECTSIPEVCEGFDSGPPPPPPPTAYDACSLPSECILTANTCCGVCGRPTRADVAAINASARDDYYLDVACPEARTSPPACPDCPAALNPNLLATCDGARCRVVDLETDPGFQECVENSDCFVRARDCCECGADVSLPNLVALATSARAAFEAVVCDPGTGCPECAPVYPEDISAGCDMGRCALVGMMSTP